MTGAILTLAMTAATVFPMWTILRRLDMDLRRSPIRVTGVGVVAPLPNVAFGRNVGRETLR